MPKARAQRAVIGGGIAALVFLGGCTGPVAEYADRPGQYRLEIYPPMAASQRAAISQAALFCGLRPPRNRQQETQMAHALNIRHNAGYLTRTILEFRCP